MTRPSPPQDVETLVATIHEAIGPPHGDREKAHAHIELDRLAARLAEAEAQLAEIEHAAPPTPEAWHAVNDRVAALEAARKAARDLYDDAGVADIDPRLDYVVLQVTREVWNDFVAALDPAPSQPAQPDEEER